jgi:hypothetical protein
MHFIISLLRIGGKSYYVQHWSAIGVRMLILGYQQLLPTEMNYRLCNINFDINIISFNNSSIGNWALTKSIKTKSTIKLTSLKSVVLSDVSF